MRACSIHDFVQVPKVPYLTYIHICQGKLLSFCMLQLVGHMM